MKPLKGFPAHTIPRKKRFGWDMETQQKLTEKLPKKHILTRSVDIDRSETLYDIGLHTEDCRREYVQLLRKASKNSKQLIALRDYFENIGFVESTVSLSLQLSC